MALTKIGDWDNPVVNEADRPNRRPADMKAIFDSNSNQIREAFNRLVDDVESGNASMAFSQALARANIESGDSLVVILGKISKYFEDAETAIQTVQVDENYPLRYLCMDGTYKVPAAGEAANGVAEGGTTGQAYVKQSVTDYDGGWETLDAEFVGAIPAAEKGARNGVATLNSGGFVTAEQARAEMATKTASYTLQNSDAGKFIRANSSSAITITIPTGITAGSEIEIARMGSGAVTIATASGVTLHSANNFKKITYRYGVCCLKCVNTNEWLLVGDLS